MHVETQLGKTLNVADAGIQYDQAAKKVLSNKEIVARMMKACVDEYEDCEIEDIKNKYLVNDPLVSKIAVDPDETNLNLLRGFNTEDGTLKEGVNVYDVLLEAYAPKLSGFVGELFDIEAEKDSHRKYRLNKRAIFNVSRMISSQKGSFFTKTNYNALLKVNSIWICMNPPKRRRNTMNTYALCEKNRVGNYKEKKENYDLINITFICIGHLNGKNDVGVIRLLNVIFTDQLDIESKKEILKKEFGIQMTVELEKEVSTMCNLSQGLIEKGIQQGKKEGIIQGKKEGIQEGIVQGKKEGIEIGKKQGEENMLIKSIRNLIEKAGWTAQEAMTVLGIDPNMYDVYLRKLQENISSSAG